MHFNLLEIYSGMQYTVHELHWMLWLSMCQVFTVQQQNLRKKGVLAPRKKSCYQCAFFLFMIQYRLEINQVMQPLCSLQEPIDVKKKKKGRDTKLQMNSTLFISRCFTQRCFSTGVFFFSTHSVLSVSLRPLRWQEQRRDFPKAESVDIYWVLCAELMFNKFKFRPETSLASSRHFNHLTKDDLNAKVIIFTLVKLRYNTTKWVQVRV